MALSLRTLHGVPPPIGAVVFRVDWRRSAATVTIVGALFAACVWIGRRGGVSFEHGGLPSWLAWWITAWLGIFGLLAANDLRKSLAHDAWLARAGLDGLYLKFRSYQNAHFVGEGEEVVLVPYADIACARVHGRTITTRFNREEESTLRQTFVELDLGDTDTEALAARLARERSLPRTRGRWNHFPIAIEPGNRIAIEWRARPAASAFVETLGQRGVRVEAAVTSEETYEPRQADLEQVARRGDVITLVQLLRRREGLDLAAAKQRAEAMIQRG